MLENLKSRNKTVGLKQTCKAVESKIAKTVFIAKDADEKILVKIESLCKEHATNIEYVDTMKQLGKFCGIDVGAAVASILD